MLLYLFGHCYAVISIWALLCCYIYFGNIFLLAVKFALEQAMMAQGGEEL
jgi:hypothetical protein